MKKLLPPRYTKPQNRINDSVKSKVKTEVVNWLVEFEISGYHAGLIASEILDRVITERIQATADTAPDVLMTDQSKVDSLVIASKKAIDRLDEEGKLEQLIEELVVADAQSEGNSI
jgi:hypothetical protein